LIYIGLAMNLHIFECKKCQRQQKHITSAPTPLPLSNKSECATCNKMRTFEFVREEKRKEELVLKYPAASEPETKREQTTLLS
jgi:hypothetical protein